MSDEPTPNSEPLLAELEGETHSFAPIWFTVLYGRDYVRAACELCEKFAPDSKKTTSAQPARRIRSEIIDAVLVCFGMVGAVSSAPISGMGLVLGTLLLTVVRTRRETAKHGAIYFAIYETHYEIEMSGLFHLYHWRAFSAVGFDHRGVVLIERDTRDATAILRDHFSRAEWSRFVSLLERSVPGRVLPAVSEASPRA